MLPRKKENISTGRNEMVLAIKDFENKCEKCKKLFRFNKIYIKVLKINEENYDFNAILICEECSTKEKEGGLFTSKNFLRRVGAGQFERIRRGN
jgi:hypothetical protein